MEGDLKLPRRRGRPRIHPVDSKRKITSRACRHGQYPACKDCRLSYNLKSRHGITPEDYANMVLIQESLCAICRRQCPTGKRLAIDHDHSCCAGYASCGECIRGLLCVKCNSLVGMADDNVNILRAAIAYLERNVCSQ